MPRDDWTAGYLAGSYDADGSMHVGKRDNAVNLLHGERPGIVLDEVVRLLEADSFHVKTNARKQGAAGYAPGNPFTDIQIRGGRGEIIRFLALYRPPRFVARPDLRRVYEGAAVETTIHAGRNGVSVLSVTSLGVGPVASLTTSEGTFVTGGFLTHNTDPGPRKPPWTIGQSTPPPTGGVRRKEGAEMLVQVRGNGTVYIVAGGKIVTVHDGGSLDGLVASLGPIAQIDAGTFDAMIEAYGEPV